MADDFKPANEIGSATIRLTASGAAQVEKDLGAVKSKLDEVGTTATTSGNQQVAASKKAQDATEDQAESVEKLAGSFVSMASKIGVAAGSILGAVEALKQMNGMIQEQIQLNILLADTMAKVQQMREGAVSPEGRTKSGVSQNTIANIDREMAANEGHGGFWSSSLTDMKKVRAEIDAYKTSGNILDKALGDFTDDVRDVLGVNEIERRRLSEEKRLLKLRNDLDYRGRNADKANVIAEYQQAQSNALMSGLQGFDLNSDEAVQYLRTMSQNTQFPNRSGGSN